VVRLDVISDARCDDLPSLKHIAQKEARAEADGALGDATRPRPMVTVIRPSRARCVEATIPRHERAVFTLKEGRMACFVGRKETTQQRAGQLSTLRRPNVWQRRRLAERLSAKS
jgi:hypothetical protein